MLPKPNLKKVLLIGVPLVLVGSVGAYAATNTAKGASATASASTSNSPSQNAVTSKTVSSVPLTQAEMAQLGNVQPAPSTNTGTTTNDISQSALDASNPFVVQSPSTGSTTNSASGQSGNDTTATAGTGNNTVASSAPFDINQVKNLQLQTNTTLGLLVLHFTADNNNLKLDGQLGDRHLTVQGAQAVQILTQVLQNLNLSDAFTAALQGQQVNLDNNVLSSLQNVQIQMKDGRQITTHQKGDDPKPSAPAAAPGHNPKAEGAHDNGKHKGEEKHGKNHGDD